MFDNWRLKISLEKIIGKVDSYRCPVLHEHTSDSFGTAETTCPSIMSSDSDLMDPFSPADSSVRTGTLDCTAAGRCGRVVR
jgi:hypothetical protein